MTIHLFGAPYVEGDSAPGTNGSNSYSVGTTPYTRKQNVFLLGTCTWSGAYEAFKGSGDLPYLTDGYATGSSAYFGGRGNGTFTVSTVTITSESPTAISASSVTADSLVFWQTTAGGDQITAIDLTVDGVSIGHFTPTWGPTLWHVSDAGPITYLNNYLGAPTRQDGSSQYGTWFDLGAAYSGTTWAIAITTTRVGSAVMRVTEIQAFDFTTAAMPPVANFSGTPLFGAPGLSVDFTDLSTNTPTSWAWTFGDAGTSTSQNPTHVYAAAGTYTVSLTATNADGSDGETKVAYVVVTAPEPGVVIDPTAADPVPISDDIIRWTIQRGASPEITGGASVGQATLVLKNSVEAGASEDDKYNPDNASATLIDYLRDGSAIWIGVNSDGKLAGSDPRGLFGGRTQDWTVLPSAGTTVAPTVEVTCEDALGWLGRTPVTVGFEVGRSQGDLRADVLAAAGETRVALAHEILTMPLSSGEGNALGILEEINKANGTRHFAKPADASIDWYTYTTRNRQWRLDGTTDASLSALDDHMTGMDGWRLSADTVINEQRATVTPILFSPAQTVVWRPENMPLEVTTTRPYTVWVDFDDYVSAPIVDSASSGATPTITLTPFGTSAKLEITVASGTCTFQALTIQGAQARRAPAQSWIADDLTSQALPRGVRAGSDISSEYVGTISTARGIAEHVVWRYATPQRRPTLTVVNWIPEQFDLDLYDVISFTSPQLGVTARHFEIVGLTHTGDWASDAGVSHTAVFVLQECRVQADPGWFVLDTSELDSADVLAY